MERRAEINRFAIFLFCLLVPLGSLAPIETSESNLTTAERRRSFATDIWTTASVIKDHARDLFEFYQNCVSGTFHSEPEKFRSEASDMAEKIFTCPPFHENCCVLHDIQNILKPLGSHIETICNKSSKVIDANLNELNMTLISNANFYTCKGRDPPQGPTMGLADTKTYTWWFLKRYHDIMQNAVEQHSS